MRFNAISDEFKRLIKKYNSISMFSAISIFICLFLIVISIIYNKNVNFVSVIFVGLIFEISWFVFLLHGIATIWLNRAKRIIGTNLVVSIDYNKLTLEDTYNNQPIKITHEIKDIEVLSHIFVTRHYMICKPTGLLVITDKKKFFKAMSDKYHKRLTGYQLRAALLEGGFFIACDKVDAAIITKYIKENSKK